MANCRKVIAKEVARDQQIHLPTQQQDPIQSRIARLRKVHPYQIRLDHCRSQSHRP